MPRKVEIKFRQDTLATWESVNPILDVGEIGVESDTTKAKIGDGTTAWNSLAYLSDVKSDNVATARVLRDSQGLSVLGRSTNTTGNPGDITAPSDGFVLRRNNIGLSFGQLSTESFANGAVTSEKIYNGIIVNSHISNNAEINPVKLGAGILPGYVKADTPNYIDRSITHVKLNNTVGPEGIGVWQNYSPQLLVQFPKKFFRVSTLKKTSGDNQLYSVEPLPEDELSAEAAGYVSSTGEPVLNIEGQQVYDSTSDINVQLEINAEFINSDINWENYSTWTPIVDDYYGGSEYEYEEKESRRPSLFRAHYAKYCIINNTCFVNGMLEMHNSSQFRSIAFISLPVRPNVPDYVNIGSAYHLRSISAHQVYPLRAISIDNGKLGFISYPWHPGNRYGHWLPKGRPFHYNLFHRHDKISFNLRYEIA